MDIKNIAVKDLIPYEKNTKKHDDVQINNVAESIKQYGFVQPIVIDKNNVVVIGHCRLLAAKKLKMADVPCVCVEDLTEEQVKALRIVDNKSNESPPYADLEVYSDDPRDISNMDYDDFCKVYAEIIAIACRKLKQDRFAVFVVGDIRDKKGFYRNFVDYTKKCFNENGCATYNEAILIDMLGTAMLRANGTFKSRKLVKTHQNVLVFYKGNPKTIKENYPEIEIDDSIFE